MPLGPEGGSRGDRGSVSGQPHVLVWEVTWGQMALWAPQGPAQALVPPSPSSFLLVFGVFSVLRVLVGGVSVDR